MASSRSSKRKRADRGSSGGGSEGKDDTLRLCPDLASLVGRKYVKQAELSREAMMEYLQSTDAVESVELVRVRVEQFGGDELDVVVDNQANKVSDLKRVIEEERGTKSGYQTLFLLRRGGEAVKPSEEPLDDSVVMHDGDRMALCVTGDMKWEWDTSSPLLCGGTKQVELSGENNSIATLSTDDEEDEVMLTTSEVLESGTHRISFKILMGDLLCLGVVRDGAVYDQTAELLEEESTDGWFMMINSGGLYGNGLARSKTASERPGQIKDGQILTLELDTDAGTLKFWCGGEPHGTGWERGVHGRLRWAFLPSIEGNAVQIVRTQKE